MSVISDYFDSYQYQYDSDAGWSGSTQGAAEISCIKAGVQVARLFFVKPDGVMGTNTFSNGVVDLFYPLSQFGDVIGMFRYEKILTFSLDTSTHVGGINNKVSKLGKKTP